MNFNPLVSILINNYNYDRYLASAIDSAINQTYPHVEIIVVDDGSTDNSRQIIGSYQNSITAIFKANGGQASAINVGFAASKGEIICLLDADDLWLPSKVKQIVTAFNNYSQAAVVYHKVQNINSTDKPIGKPWPPYKPIVGNISQLVNKSGGWWPFPPSTALSFSRQFLTAVMDIPEAEYRLCADAYLADLAPFLGEVVGIDLVLSQFRIHDSNNWSKEDNQWQRAVEYDRLRVNTVNHILNKHNLDFKISLSDRWPYQWLQYKLGKQHNLWKLSRLTWQNSWEHRPVSKLKTLIKLWLENLGIGSSRL
ncbi:MAG TPA: glycosyltransferase [Coleofasciculaceae cyanobacterium]|jgi:glycosyltransferase involved in cell wall biosynthesis